MATTLTRREVIKAAGLGALALTLGNSALAADLEGPATRPQRRYELPPLPYPYDALAPAIEENLLRIHHDKHHAASVKGLNSTLEKLAETRSKGDMGQIRALSRDLAFNGSGHVLHSLYWLSMKPGKSSEPGGGLREAIERDFGSFNAFKAQFVAASKNVEASGWGLLVHEPMAGRLLILQAEKHEDLAIWGSTPLLVCDVWEHAYYLQYKNMRDDYVDSFFTVIDWPAVESRFAEAVRAG